MTLRAPTPEDVSKLSAEINQVVHQRFLLTTLAITMVGVVGGWLFVKHEALFANGEIGRIVYAMSFLLLLFLFMVFFFGEMLYAKLRIYTAYLLVTEASNWEIDWKLFRDKKEYVGYRRAQSFVYVLLGLAVVFVPLVFAFVLQLRLTPYLSLAVLGIVFVLYIVFVLRMGIFRWLDPEEGVIDKWQELKKLQ